MSDPLEEHRLSSEPVFDGALLHVHRDRVRTPDGHESVREYVRHPGAVAVIAEVADGQLLLERQWRYPLARSFLEIPAGKIDRGEDPLATGKRELLEETGYVAARWTRMGTLHNAIGYSDEHIDLYLAQDLTPGTAKLDHGEVLELLTMSGEELVARIISGEVTDAKTIIAAHWYALFRAGAMPSRAPALPAISHLPVAASARPEEPKGSA